MGSVSGRVLIAGTASLLMCLFLSPKFIEFLRRREFGQNIREEGPQGHHTKAGTPTMGGIIIFAAIAVPYLLLSQRKWLSLGVFGVALACALLGFADDYTKIVKRRSLGLRARTKQLHAKARRGEIKNFTGIDSPYERPENPDVRIDTTVTTAEDAAELLLEELRTRTSRRVAALARRLSFPKAIDSNPEHSDRAGPARSTDSRNRSLRQPGGSSRSRPRLKL